LGEEERKGKQEREEREGKRGKKIFIRMMASERGKIQQTISFPP